MHIPPQNSTEKEMEKHLSRLNKCMGKQKAADLIRSTKDHAKWRRIKVDNINLPSREEYSKQGHQCTSQNK